MKIKRTPMLNNYEQQLNYPQCEIIDEIEKNKGDDLTSEEDGTEQDREEETKKKGENITCYVNIPQHDRDQNG